MIPSCIRVIVTGAALAALLAGPLRAESVVEGRVALPKADHAPVLNQRYSIVAHNGVLSPYPPLAVVYLEGSFPAPAVLPDAQMVQRDLNFFPALLPVMVGTRVAFPNEDDTYHNVFSYSPAKRFDLGRYRADEKPVPTEVFDVAGLVTLRCDIHEHMRAIILVLNTPHFVLSDAAGAYRLAGLPAGRFVLKVWLDSKTTLERAVELRPGETLHADFP
jgi:plastocyanin